jgi:hypothetical protein
MLQDTVDVVAMERLTVGSQFALKFSEFDFGFDIPLRCVPRVLPFFDCSVRVVVLRIRGAS